jgi:hypothetical protein
MSDMAKAFTGVRLPDLSQPEPELPTPIVRISLPLTVDGYPIFFGFLLFIDETINRLLTPPTSASHSTLIFTTRSTTQHLIKPETIL